jgi:hypothetical protein
LSCFKCIKTFNASMDNTDNNCMDGSSIDGSRTLETCQDGDVCFKEIKNTMGVC